jgi:hypothetical protein
MRRGWLWVLTVGLEVGQIIESQRGTADKAHWKKRNSRDVLLLLGALLMLIPLIYLCIDVYWLVIMLLSAIVHLAHNMRRRLKFEQFERAPAAPSDSSGKEVC